MQTATRTTIATILEQIQRVTRSVNSDLLYLVDQYQQLTESQARDYINDFRVFMNYGVIDAIKLLWTDRATGKVVDGIRYIVENGQAVRENDRPGDLAYDSSLKSANFVVQLEPSNAWGRLTTSEQQAMQSDLRGSWVDAPALDYSLGRFVGDKTYSQTDIALRRQRFQRS